MSDFLNEVPTNDKGENMPKNGVNAYLSPLNGEKRRKTVNAVTAILLAVACFILGGFAVWFSLDSEIRTLLKIKRGIQKHYYQEIDDEEFYGAVFDAVNYDLLDAYSRYMTADEYRAAQGDLAGNRIGIGLVFQTKDENGNEQMQTVRVCGNSPAAEAGVREGDYVVGYGKTSTTMVESTSFDEFSAFLNALNEGELFHAQVRRGAQTLTLTMSREEYVENYVFYRTNKTAFGFTGEKANEWTETGAPLSCLPDDTAYIRLIQFGEGTEDPFAVAMERFKADGKKNLVLDLRDNGGGYLDTMQELAGYFCKTATERKPVVVVSEGKDNKEIFKAKRNVYGEYFSADSRICVIADSGTASASECLIGCMVDYEAVGFEDICLIERGGAAKTYGKGIMQTTYYLGVKLDALKLTTAEIRWPVSDKSIHGKGILPEDGAKTAKENGYGDEEIEKALEVLFQ